MLSKLASFFWWVAGNLAAILACSVIGFACYSLYQDVQRSNAKEKEYEERYGKEYNRSWHSQDDKEPTKLTHVKGLEDCIYVVMELTRNDTRHVIRCKGDAQVTVPGKFPKTTALVN